MHRIDAHLGGVRWAGSFEVDRLGQLGVHGRGLDRRVRDLARRARAQGRRAASTTSPARCPRACCYWATPPRAPPAARTGADRARRSHARRRRPCPRTPSTTSRSAPSCSPRVERGQQRHGAPALPAPLDLEVDRLRARFGAWYELFPRSWGGLKGVEQPAPAARRARLRRPLPAADPPDRPHQPQGPRQLADRRPRRSRLPVGDRRRDRRPRRGPPRPRHDRRPAQPDRDRGRARASTSRSTSRSSARPTTRGCTSTPSGFTAAPTAR